LRWLHEPYNVVTLAKVNIRELKVPGDAIGIATTDYPDRLQATPFGKTIVTEGRVVYARST
jgi:hypothetical protein